MINNQHDIEKRLRLYEYRAKRAEAENTAVKGSKAYRAIKLVGSIRSSLRNDPVGLTKKAARIMLREPTKIFSKRKNRQTIIQSVIDQTNKYQEWILLNEPREDELAEQRAQSDKYTYQPLISIITPVFNPPVKVFEDLIESVLDQTYSNFELCLGNFGNDSKIEEIIQRYASVDRRVKNWQFTENKGIGENSNLILSKVSGEYIALLDHDDTLSPDALYENVKALNKERHDLIYSDKDKIDEAGNRFDPLFKADYSPEMMLNINYLTHLNVMKTSVVKGVGAWDSDTDGAQDWDLFLKVAAVANSIHHIPKILYHWRVIASSTAMSIDTKPYALAGQRNAVDKYLNSKDIPGVSFHQKTELFIRWQKDSIDSAPLVVIDAHSRSSTMRAVRSVVKYASGAMFIVTIEDGLLPNNFLSKDNHILGVLPKSEYSIEAIVKLAEKHDIELKGHTVLFINDCLKLSHNWYSALSGWLSIPGVGATSGRVIDESSLIVDCGGVVTDGVYQPIYRGFPRFYQSYIGNAEWVRNLSMLSGVISATKGEYIERFCIEKKNTPTGIYDYFNWLRIKDFRLLMTPQCTVEVHNVTSLDGVYKSIPNFVDNGIDTYSNPNISTEDPMRLFADETLVAAEDTNERIDPYQRDAIILAQCYDISDEELELNADSMTKHNNKTPKTVAFILPSFDAIYAGLMNIFSFAEYLQKKEGLEVSFYILKAGKNANDERNMVLEKIPALNKASYTTITEQQADKLSPHDIGIATLWSTAFVLAKTKHISRKCYFIQDNETNFYPKGTLSALVEMSYRFGFYALANTDGLLDFYKKTYNGRGTVLQSKVDLANYHPNRDLYRKPKSPYRVFFYARPNMPRNAFELGVAGLKKLKREMGDDIEIITAGAPWSPKTYDVEGLFTNLGRVNYDTVPVLYRSVDAGLMFMFSGHPGVTASELMASGCPVVVNEYDDITWNELYQHEKTCLITRPTASEVARNLKRCILDRELRETLIKNGLAKTEAFYESYEDNQPKAYKAMLEYFNKLK